MKYEQDPALKVAAWFIIANVIAVWIFIFLYDHGY
jgi:hypothetical protein